MRSLAVSLFLLAFGTSARAEEQCSPDIVGASDSASIDKFVAAVHEAMANPEIDRLTAIVRFPLRVYSQDPQYHQTRSLSIRNRDELRKYADAIFTKSFRQHISDEPARDLICRTAEIGFGGGMMWARTDEQGGLRIEVIKNDEFQWPDMTTGELLRCETPERLIVIDRPRASVRYRAWPKGRSSTGTPDQTMDDGREAFEGSGVCEHPIWTFAKGTQNYVVSEGGCGEESAPAATVSLMKKTKLVKEWKCRAPKATAP